MSFTYGGNLNISNRDMVRFLIGDTHSTTATPHLVEDGEIDSLLQSNPNQPWLVAQYCAESIATRFSGVADRTIGDLKISYANQANNWRKISVRLAAQASVRAAPPYAGGISQSDKANDRRDTDLVQPAFSVDMQQIMPAPPPPDWKTR